MAYWSEKLSQRCLVLRKRPGQWCMAVLFWFGLAGCATCPCMDTARVDLGSEIPVAADLALPCPGRTEIHSGVSVRLVADTALVCAGGDPLARIDGVEKLVIADMNGDGEPDLVYQWRPPDGPPRVHIVGMDAQGIKPLWRGSRMSGPLLSFDLVDPDATAPLLVALERIDNRLWLVGYQWQDFGLYGRCRVQTHEGPGSAGIQVTILSCPVGSVRCVTVGAGVSGLECESVTHQ